VIKTAIILAQNEKGLQPLFGIPAVRRLALLVLKMGVETIHVIGDHGALTRVLSDLLPAEAIHDASNEETMRLVLAGLTYPDEERLLIVPANIVIDRHSLANFIDAGGKRALYCMKAVNLDGSRGLCLIGHSDLDATLHFLRPSDESRINETPEGMAFHSSTSGLPFAINSGADAKLAEARLIEALALQTEATDGFLARHVDRRVSRFFSGLLAHTRITPNQITFLGVTIGLLGAFLLSRPGYWHPLIGSLLFLFCVTVDGVDGEVARLKLKESSFGHYLDIISDNMVNIAVFIGIAFGLYQDSGNAGYLRALFFLLGGFALCSVAVYQCILRRSTEELEQSPGSLRIMKLATNRDFAYLVVAFALFYRLDWFLMGTAVGTYLFAATLWTIYLYEKWTSVS
jgi:phosphatidylglycerophosphate synthase